MQILVQRINEKYSAPGYQPVVWLDRPVPLYERIALYSIADCAVVTCVRDGMNLAPYEYIVCRQGAPVSYAVVPAFVFGPSFDVPADACVRIRPAGHVASAVWAVAWLNVSCARYAWPADGCLHTKQKPAWQFAMHSLHWPHGAHDDAHNLHWNAASQGWPHAAFSILKPITVQQAAGGLIHAQVRLCPYEQWYARKACCSSHCRPVSVRELMWHNGTQDVDEEHKTSMLVLSEFVGCSPSVSGAIRVNPWSIDAVADGIYAAIKMPLRDQHLRHAKHWRYISQHTVKYWAQVWAQLLQQHSEHHFAAELECVWVRRGSTPSHASTPSVGS